jgi:DNA-binding protein HU-beta
MPETITLKQFSNELAADRGMPPGDARAMVQAMLDKIDQHLKARDKVQFTSWFSVEPKERAARTGRNPQTGETIQIAAHLTPHFDVSSKWRDSLTQALAPKVTRRRRKTAPKAEAAAVTPTVTRRRRAAKPAEAPAPAAPDLIGGERQRITAQMQSLKTQIDQLQDLSMQRAIEGKDLARRDQEKLMRLQSQWGTLSDKLRAMGPAKRTRRKEAAIA